MGGASETTREKLEIEHWRLACLVLKHHNNELMMESKGIEISRKHDDPSVIIYKRKKPTDVLENEQKRDKCQECVKFVKLKVQLKNNCYVINQSLKEIYI
ncbi:hypothetical protein MKX03_017725, partial [Papaver bracteatum]